MTLPVANLPISLLAIRDEFRQGATTPISFLNYYKSHPMGYVISSDVTAPNVPQWMTTPVLSGPISFHHFHGAARYVAPLSSVNLDTTTASGSCYNLGGSCTATSNYVNATPVGGTAPFTYAWEWVSGSTHTVSGGTTASCRWSHSCGWDAIGEVGRSFTGAYRCKVTDSLGATAYSANVTVTLWNDAP